MIAALCAGLAVIGGFSRDAGACGALFTSVTDTELADMSDQRVLMIFTDDGRVEHLVQVAYEGKPMSFAWVYPFPDRPEIDEADEAVFSRLDNETRPSFRIVTDYGDDGGGCGCPLPFPGGAADGTPQDAGVDATPPVTVWDTGQVGIFDYAVITAVTIDDMIQWLTDNGYRAPADANAVLDHYVTLGWYFVAMKISQATTTTTTKTSVLRFTYPYGSMTYPLYMSSISPAASVGVILYVVAPHRVEMTGGFSSVEIDGEEVQATSENTTNYETLFRDAIEAAGGRAFVTEYVGAGAENILSGLELIPEGTTGLYLTRLRTSLSPALMTSDVEFVFAVTDDIFESDFYLYYPSAVDDAGAGPLLPVLIFMLGSLIFRALARRRG